MALRLGPPPEPEGNQRFDACRPLGQAEARRGTYNQATGGDCGDGERMHRIELHVHGPPQPTHSECLEHPGQRNETLTTRGSADPRTPSGTFSADDDTKVNLINNRRCFRRRYRLHDLVASLAAGRGWRIPDVGEAIS